MLELCHCSPTRLEALVYLAAFLYFTGENVVINTSLPFITFGVCRQQYPNISVHDCRNIERDFELADELQASSAFYYMIEKMVSFIPSLLLATFFGPWSDQHGRRLPFLLPFIGNLTAVVLFLVSYCLPAFSGISFVMIVFLVRSFTGHVVLFRLISFSYISDLIHSRSSYEYTKIGIDRNTVGNGQYYTEEGTKGGVAVEVAGARDGEKDQSEFLTCMCRLQIAESMGNVAGSGLAWALQAGNGQVLALSIGAGFQLLGALDVLFCLRNVHSNQNKTEEKGSVLMACVKKIAGVFRGGEVDVDRVQMWGCILIIFLMMGCIEGRDSITIPYVMNYPFSWPSRRFSAYVACFGLFQSVFLLVIAPKMKDHSVVVVSLLGSLVGGVWMAFCTTTWSMMLAGCISHMTNCIFPAVKAILNKDLPLDQVGKVLSRVSLAETLSLILGPLVIEQLYEHTQSYFPGLTFLVSSAIPAVILAGILVRSLCPEQSKSRGEQFQLFDLERSKLVDKSDLTKSLSVPSVTASGYGFLWRSSEW